MTALAAPAREPPARLLSLVSPHTGVVRALHERLRLPDDALLHVYSCEVARDGAEASPEPALAAGWGPTRDMAVAAAVGEAVERYSGSFVPESELVLASARSLGASAVDAERFTLFRDDQLAERWFRARRFTRDTVVRWVRGFALPGGEPAYLPAQLVYLTGAAPEREAVIGYSTSSGLACGAGLPTAVLAGLLEVVERDAFMIAWYDRLSLPRLEWSGEPALLELERRYFAPSRLAYEVVDLSVFLDVPTALALVDCDASRPGVLGVGAASAPTMAEAWQRALSEAFATRSAARLLRAQAPGRRFRADFADVVSFDDHILFYADGRNVPHASFLASSPETRPASAVQGLEGASASEHIEAVCRRLAARGASAYAVDVTAPDIREAGLSVARVVAPELCPLDVAYRARFLGCERLYSAAADLGLRRTRLAREELNPYPHPFP